MSERQREILLLEASGRRFGFDVAEVLRIVPAVRSVPLPHSSSAIEGIINLHGQTVPVVDLCAWIGGAPKVPDLGDLLVILNIAGHCIAVRADRAEGVVLAAATAGLAEDRAAQPAHFAAIALIEDKIVLLPELSSFLAQLPDGLPIARGPMAA